MKERPQTKHQNKNPLRRVRQRSEGDLLRVAGVTGWLDEDAEVSTPPISRVRRDEVTVVPGQVEDGPRLVLVADSFGIALSQTLARHVGEVIFVWRPTPTLERLPQADAVVVVMAERRLYHPLDMKEGSAQKD